MFILDFCQQVGAAAIADLLGRILKKSTSDASACSITSTNFLLRVAKTVLNSMAQSAKFVVPCENLDALEMTLLDPATVPLATSSAATMPIGHRLQQLLLVSLLLCQQRLHHLKEELRNRIRRLHGGRHSWATTRSAAMFVV